MKDLAYFFDRDSIRDYLLLQEPETRKSRNFEFIAALMMQRLYETQWGAPVLIGYYLKEEFAKLLKENERSHEVYAKVFEHGINHDHIIDFHLINPNTLSGQMFQLKTLGTHGQEVSTEQFTAYVNELWKKYPPTDASCLVAITQINLINWVKAAENFNKEKFPFTELLAVGVFNDDFVTVGLKPESGWGAYPLSSVL